MDEVLVVDSQGLSVHDVSMLLADNIELVYNEIIKSKICHMAVYLDKDGSLKMAVCLPKT